MVDMVAFCSLLFKIVVSLLKICFKLDLGVQGCLLDIGHSSLLVLRFLQFPLYDECPVFRPRRKSFIK